MCTLWYVNAILLFFSLSLKHTPHSFIKKRPSKIIVEFQHDWLALKKAVEGFLRCVFTHALPRGWFLTSASIARFLPVPPEV